MTLPRGLHRPTAEMVQTAANGAEVIWRLSVAIMVSIAAADALLGPGVTLIGLLMLGACCALLSARRVPTAEVGAMAVGLAFVLALPDGIWATVPQFALVTAVLMVAGLYLGRRDLGVGDPTLARSSRRPNGVSSRPRALSS